MITRKNKLIHAKSTFRISNFIARYRKKNSDDSTISLEELKKWCSEHRVIPNDEAKAFVSDFYPAVNQHDQVTQTFNYRKVLFKRPDLIPRNRLIKT